MTIEQAVRDYVLSVNGEGNLLKCRLSVWIFVELYVIMSMRKGKSYSD